MTIEYQTQISRNPSIISSRMDDEVVMMSIEKGNYYGLNPVAAEIWEMLTKTLTVRQICDRLMEEFEVTEEQCFREVTTYLGKLSAEGLIVVENLPVQPAGQ